MVVCRGTQNDQAVTPVSYVQVVEGVQIRIKYKTQRTVLSGPACPPGDLHNMFTSSAGGFGLQSSLRIRGSPAQPCLRPLHQLLLIQQSLFALHGTLAFKGNRALSGCLTHSYSVAARTRPA